MTYDEDARLSSDTSERTARRRRQIAIGVAGAAAVLGGAGLLATQLMNESQPDRPEPAALAPQTTSASPEASADDRTPGKATKQAAPMRRSPAPTPAASRPASPGPDAAQASSAIADLRKRFGFGGPGIAERTERLGSGTVHIMTARSDLTDDRKMIVSGDDGTAVGGGVRCTTDVPPGMAMSPSPSPEALLCWRTSTDRSVITMATTAEGEPSTADSVAVIQREWDRLG
ncbi:hypothetical protein [Actinoplanes flavus]|uniref:Uncharacterized protein n=1 Tax=Actinoplanes flavus TaxID=2820290 RepID=A0ABS3UU42_9ACTN|nr:hypothetical protein [Actinoplanes flavus]MBO3742111.1 hypothetical protein [Actinoplanes flavus]